MANSLLREPITRVSWSLRLVAAICFGYTLFEKYNLAERRPNER